MNWFNYIQPLILVHFLRPKKKTETLSEVVFFFIEKLGFNLYIAIWLCECGASFFQRLDELICAPQRMHIGFYLSRVRFFFVAFVSFLSFLFPNTFEDPRCRLWFELLSLESMLEQLRMLPFFDHKNAHCIAQQAKRNATRTMKREYQMPKS